MSLKLVPVTPIEQRRTRDTILALEQLLAQARDGKIRGLIWIVKYDSNNHAPGATGEYVKYPMSAIGAAQALVDTLIHKYL